MNAIRYACLFLSFFLFSVLSIPSFSGTLNCRFSQQLKGDIESISQNNDIYTVKGWACLRRCSDSIDVALSFQQTADAISAALPSSQEVHSVCGASGDYNFEVEVSSRQLALNRLKGAAVSIDAIYGSLITSKRRSIPNSNALEYPSELYREEILVPIIVSDLPIFIPYKANFQGRDFEYAEARLFDQPTVVVPSRYPFQLQWRIEDGYVVSVNSEGSYPSEYSNTYTITDTTTYYIKALDEQHLLETSVLLTIDVDLDGDGIGNQTDQDDDGDGIPDLVEKLIGSDPLTGYAHVDQDIDSDGLADWWEIFNFGSLAFDGDHDVNNDKIDLADEFADSTLASDAPLLVDPCDGGCSAYNKTSQSPAAPPYAPATVQSEMVAAIAGSFSVNEGGGAAYSIPVFRTEGVAGVAPDVAISYSSQSYNGLLGVGWQLSASSSIIECADPKYGKGFCLDGQRLLPTTGRKGSTVYVSERIAGSEAYRIGDSWVVESKDGTTRKYGETSSSTVKRLGEPSTRTIGYYLSSVSDNMGNKIDYIYDKTQTPVNQTNSDTLPLLQRIEYAEGEAKVEFAYEDREDKMTRSIGVGYPIFVTSDQRLSSITVSNHGDDVRFYDFEYAEDSQTTFSKLLKIRECATSAAHICKQATDITWNNTSLTYDNSEVTLNTDHSTVTSDGPFSGPEFVTPAIDLMDHDGDGDLDLIWGVHTGGGSYWNRREGYKPSPTITALRMSSYDGSSASFIDQKTGQTSFGRANNIHFGYDQTGYFPRTAVVDMNSDGHTDLLYYSQGGGKGYWYVRYAVYSPDEAHAGGSGWTLGRVFKFAAIETVEALFQDVNGDGVTDVVYIDGGVLSIRYGAIGTYTRSGSADSFDINQLGSEKQLLRNVSGKSVVKGLIDIDHDSVLELVIRDNDTAKILKLTSDSTVTAIFSEPLSSSADRNDWSITDVLGDGRYVLLKKADFKKDGTLKFTPTYSAKWLVPTGVNSWGLSDSGSTSFRNNRLTENSIYGSPQFVDMDHDGVNELVIRSRPLMLDEPIQIPGLPGKEHYLFSDDHFLRVGKWNLSTNTFEFGAVSGTEENTVLAEVYPQNFGLDQAISIHPKAQFAVVDVNGDGSKDLFYTEYTDNEQSKVYVQLGRQSESAQFVSTPLVTTISNGMGSQATIKYGLMTRSKHYQFPAIGTVEGQDFDKYANFDLTYEGRSGYMSARKKTWSSRYAELGSDILVSQKGLNSVGVYDMRVPVPIVESVITPVSNGESHTINRVDYYYAGGRIQANGVGPLGFAHVRTVKERNGGELVTTTHYRQDYPFVGLPIKTTVDFVPGASSSGEFHRSVKLTDWKAILYGGSSWHASTGFSAVRVYAAERKDLTYEGGTLLKTEKVKSTQDKYGNETKTIQTISSPAFSQDAVNTPAFSYSSTVTNTFPSADGDAKFYGRLEDSTVVHSRSVGGSPTSSITRKSSFTYNADNLLWTTTINPDSDDVTAKSVTTYGYDTYGNIQTETQSWFDHTGKNFESKTTNTYENGRYLTEARNAYGQVVKRNSNFNRFGMPEKTVDISGVQTTHVYGEFGTAYQTYNTLGAYKTTTKQFADDRCPAIAQYVIVEDSAGGATGYKCFDLSDKNIKTAKRGFNGQWIESFSRYDPQTGNPIQTSIPMYQGVSSTRWITNSYDVNDRLITTTKPGGSSQTNSYTNLVTTETITGQDSVERSKTIARNAVGEKISVIEARSLITYTYNSMGELHVMTASDKSVHSEKSVTTTVNNEYSRKSSLVDSAKGTTYYEYNSLNLVEKQTDANNEVTVTKFDLEGRKVLEQFKSSSNTIVASNTWAYNNTDSVISVTINNSPYWIPQSALKQTVATTPQGATKTEKFGYDSAGRLSIKATTIDRGENDESTYYESYTFDAYNRLYQEFDASGGGQGTQNTYNEYGYLTQISETSELPALAGTVYLKINAMDAWDNVTDKTERGDLQTTYVYDDDINVIRSIVAIRAQGLGAVEQAMSFTYDDLGQIRFRHDVLENRTTQYCYYEDSGTLRGEHLSELTATPSGYEITESISAFDNTSCEESVTYDGLGNIRGYRTRQNGTLVDASYTYHDAGSPYRVDTFTLGDAPARTMAYDGKGNITNNGTAQISYSQFDKPLLISSGADSTAFYYGADRARFRRVDTTQDGESEKLYLGAVEILSNSNGTEAKRYVGGMLITATAGDPLQIDFLLKDNLGSFVISVNALSTDDAGQLQRFDAWGRPVYDIVSVSGSLVSLIPDFNTDRGFTGHEMLSAFGLIHMNGRIYDPQLRRFLTADPFVQDADNIQSLNRYAYGHNSPVNGADPSGYFWNLIVAAVGWVTSFVGVITDNPTLMQIGGALACFNAISCVAHTLIFTHHATGDWNLAFRAGATAVASSYAYGATAGLNPGGRIITNAVIAGIGSSIQGGDFGHAFLAAGISGGVGYGTAVGTSGMSKAAAMATKTIVSAAIGGTISKLSGGKFANGAVTGAFAYAMSAAASGRIGEDAGDSINTEGLTDEQKAANIKTNTGRMEKALEVIGEETGMDVFSDIKLVSNLRDGSGTLLKAATQCSGGGIYCSSTVLVNKEYFQSNLSSEGVLRTAYHETLHLNDTFYRRDAWFDMLDGGANHHRIYTQAEGMLYMNTGSNSAIRNAYYNAVGR